MTQLIASRIAELEAEYIAIPAPTKDRAKYLAAAVRELKRIAHPSQAAGAVLIK